MSLDKLNTEIRQEQIAQAALSLLNNHGIKKLSIINVARRVGLVPSGIYRHFPSKEQIIDAVVDLIFSRLVNNVTEICKETQDPLDQLRKLLVRHVEMIRENHAIPRIIFSEEVYDGSPQRKARIYEGVAMYLKKIAEIIKEGQLKKYIRKDLDADSVSVMFLGMIQPAAILWHISDEQFDINKHAEKAWILFKESLVKI